jgi:cell division protease FtsH
VRSVWFDEAVDRTLAGPERSGRIPSVEERRITAVHESGHAVVITAIQTGEPVHKVSIVGRDRALGMTVAVPDDDRELRTRSELVHDLVALLAGRAAETVILGEPSSAAADDIHRATEIARRMVCDLGMSETLGPRRIGAPTGEEESSKTGISDELAARVDEEIGRLLAEASSKAVAVVMANRVAVERLAEELLDHETVRDEALETLLSEVVTQPALPFNGSMDTGVAGPDVIAELGEREETP